MKKSIIIVIIVIVIAAVLWYLFKGNSAAGTTLAGLTGSGKKPYKPSGEALNVRSWGVYEGISPTPYVELTNWGAFAWNVRDLLTEGATQDDRQKNQQFYDNNAGLILGFFKGMNINPAIWWGAFKALTPDIKAYLASSSAKDVTKISVGEFLNNA